MPRSSAKNLAHRRAAYTGEHHVAAKRGINRNSDIGLDTCSPAQEKFRTLLGAYLFNGGQASALSGSSSVATITCYTITISPRYDDLCVVADCPTNVLGYLVPSGADNYFGEVPGLRLHRTMGRESYSLMHLPTGARMTVTDDPRTMFRQKYDGIRLHPPTGLWTVDRPLTMIEQDWLRYDPYPEGGAAKIVRALVTRLTTDDRDGKWAMGGWFWDPLHRSQERKGFRSGTERRLIGKGQHWALKWDGYPYLADVVAMLVDDEVGLPGLVVTERSLGVDLALEGGTVRLEPLSPY